MRFPFPPEETNATTEISPEAVSDIGRTTSALTIVTQGESANDVLAIEPAAPEPSSLRSELVPSECLSEPTATSSEDTEIPGSALESSTVAPRLVAEPPTSQPHAEVQLEVPAQPRPRPKRKVIAFPRPPEAAESLHRLADPVLPQQSLILDVPEELEAYPTTPFLEGLQFPSPTQAAALAVERVELPVRAAGIPRRMYSATIDCALVLLSAAVFGFVAHKMVPNLVFSKPVRLTAALVPCLLWMIFEYLLLVYAGRTAGMQIAGLRLWTFGGRRPTLRHRRNRVFGLYLSAASLVMGLLWAFVDVDTLCWHDRISGTYLTKQE